MVCSFLVPGVWSLVTGSWLLAAGYWLLVTGFLSLVSGNSEIQKVSQQPPANDQTQASTAQPPDARNQKPATSNQLPETSNQKITVEAIRKPNSVPGTGYPEPGNDHSSKDADCSTPLATYPEAWTGSPQTLPYLVLHQVGFA